MLVPPHFPHHILDNFVLSDFLKTSSGTGLWFRAYQNLEGCVYMCVSLYTVAYTPVCLLWHIGLYAVILQAVVYLMDHGGEEEIPVSALVPLPEQFQLFPFQMLHCCFSHPFGLTFSREVGSCVCVCAYACMLHEQ